MRALPEFRLFVASVIAMLVATVIHAPDAKAATWWWNMATTGTWSDSGLWSNAATGGSTGAGPANSTTTDVVVFNQTGVNGTVAALLNADQSIGGITGTNTGATTIRSADATTRTLTLGTSGITVGAGAGAFTIGTTGSVVNVAISGSQTWTNNSSDMFTVNGSVTSSVTPGTLTVAGSGNTTVSSSIANGTGTLALVKVGTGTLALSGPIGYTGSTTVDGGTLELLGGSSATMGLVTAGRGGVITIRSNTYALTGFTLGALGASGVGTVNQAGGVVTMTGASQQLILANAASSVSTYTLSSGTLRSTVSSVNRGIWIVRNSNSSGTFAMSGGAVDMPSATLLLGGTDNFTNQTAVFSQTGGVATLGNLSLGGSGTSGSGGAQTLTVTGGTFTTGTFLRLAAGNSNVATITIGGSADVTLPGFPTVSGSGATATLYLNGGVLRPAAASTAYMGGLTNAFVQAGGATVNVASGRDITISQALLADGTSPGGGLTKQGGGTLTLSGSNTYSGNTVISGTGSVLKLGAAGSFTNSSTIVVGDASSMGAILDLSDKSGTFAFGSEQTLKGGGTIKGDGDLTVEVLGSFSPGNSPGLFTYDNVATVLSGTTLMEIWGTNRATAASHPSGYYDAVDVINGGTLTFGGLLQLEVTQLFPDNTIFNLFTASGTGSSLTGNFSSIEFTWASSYAGLTFTQGTSNPNVWTSTANQAGQSFTFDAAAGTLVIVPEPSTVIFAGIGIAMAGWSYWNRRRIPRDRVK